MTRSRFSLAAWVFAVGFAAESFAQTTDAAEAVPQAVAAAAEIAERIVSEDRAVVEAAVAELRQQGPAGLQRLFDLRQQWLDAGTHAEDIPRLELAIDRVGGQRYCAASRLFWYTDLDQAKAAAKAGGKPILSLRMLGKLTEDLSCANSRFFRTTLYANEQISAVMRDNFILHWKSVRPVPKVTIDFGDGRVLHRTLTGNSIHYVLDADGRVIDGLPGLHGPKNFLAWLTTMQQAAQFLREPPREGLAPDDVVKWFHEQQVRELVGQWEADVRRIRESTDRQRQLEELAAQLDAGQQVATAPRAAEAAPIARPKAILEIPILAKVMDQAVKLETDTEAEMWDQIAALHAEDAKLDEASIALIRRQNPAAANAMKVAVTKGRVEEPVLKIVGNLQTSISLDTVRNEYLLHRRLHEWFAQGQAPQDIEELNERVYAELFLTPRSDPWLGLMPADAYSALPNDGLVVSPARK